MGSLSGCVIIGARSDRKNILLYNRMVHSLRIPAIMETPIRTSIFSILIWFIPGSLHREVFWISFGRILFTRVISESMIPISKILIIQFQHLRIIIFHWKLFIILMRFLLKKEITMISRIGGATICNKKLLQKERRILFSTIEKLFTKSL